MNKYSQIIKISFSALVVLTCALICPLFAHNTSWNKAVITVKDNRLNLKLRVVQCDLLCAVNPGRDSTVALSSEEWEELMPAIRTYLFENTILTINGIALQDGLDENWRLENTPSADQNKVDTLMGVIEISRSWNIAVSIEKLELRLNILENADMPVKWVVLISESGAQSNKLYRIINRSEPAFYDFTRHTWTDSKGKAVSSGDESSVWGAITQFVSMGFSSISLENVFKSTEDPHVMILYLLMAIIIGAFHSLSPGHGKALIGAYIIGTKGTVGDAVTLGIVTAASHTVSVLILGVILLLAFNSVVPDNIAAYLNAVSGLIIVIIGFYLLRQRVRDLLHKHHSHERHAHNHSEHSHHEQDNHDHHHSHHDGHDHIHDHHHHHAHEHSDHVHHQNGHDHEHHHDEDHHANGHDHTHITMESIQKKGFWTNIMMGISGGMVPCPTALVVLFLAISVKKLALGLLLIVFFSFGLAATLTVLGILFAKGSKLIDRYDNNNIVPKLPVISAGIIIILGTAIAIRALAGIL